MGIPVEQTITRKGCILNIEAIRTDGGTQNRTTDSALIRQYATLMATGVEFPPLTVWFDGSHYWLTDGFHRLGAAKQCGFKRISADIHAGTLEDAVWDSFRANAQHGLRRRRSDVALLIGRVLKHSKGSGLSNVELAKHLGIPEPTVRRWRKRLSSSNDDDGYRRVNRNGTSYTLHFSRDAKPPRGRNPKLKAKEQLQRELSEMKRAASYDINQLLTAIGHWMADGTPSDCLLALNTLVTSWKSCCTPTHNA
jgi:transposase